MIAKLKLRARLQWLRLKRWHYNERRWNYENAAMRLESSELGEAGEVAQANKYMELTMRAEADVLALESELLDLRSTPQ
jgi:NTP pyrophosphatase (non-canonical NTP hydrolase)